MLSYQQAIKELAQREWEDMNFMSADEFWDSTCGRHYYIAQKGDCNIPDGEVYTAPIKDSVNGTITYNTPSIYQGTTFENISFTFKNGKIVEHARGVHDEDPDLHGQLNLKVSLRPLHF